MPAKSSGFEYGVMVPSNGLSYKNDEELASLW